MSFAAPAILLLLLPWLAVVVRWFVRRGTETDVPFVGLWPISTPSARTGRRAAWPPAWAMLMLAAGGMAIVAAAGPGRGTRAAPVTVLIDRGVAMAARLDATSGRTRLGELVERFRARAAAEGMEVASWVVVPEDGVPSAGRGTQDPFPLVPSSFETGTELARRAGELLARGSTPLVVLGGLAGSDASRPVVIAPPATLPPDWRNVGLVLASATDDPAQVLVRLRAWGRTGETTVRVESDGVEATRRLAIEPDRDEAIVMELPRLGETVEVQLVTAGDCLPADDRAWLVRDGNWPKVEAMGAVPEAMSRLIRAYGMTRPPEGTTVVVHVAGRLDAIPVGGAGVLVSFDGVDAFPRGELMIRPGPGAVPAWAALDWSRLLVDARLGPEPGLGWRPVVSVGGRTVLAESVGAPRRVWLNAWSEAMAGEPDFVVLLGSILDSFAEPGAVWTARPIREYRPELRLTAGGIDGIEPQPGVYAAPSGRRLGLFVPAVPLEPGERPAIAGNDAIGTQPERAWRERGADWSAMTLAAALVFGLAGAAAAAFPGQGIGGFRRGRAA